MGLRSPLLLLALAVLIPFGAISTQSTRASGSSAAASIAQVRYIYHGLTVQPPQARSSNGKVKQPLYNSYGLQTQSKQKASIRFRDGTLLQMNQLTTAVLRSPILTQVKSGEVEERVVPGSNHQVQTAAAVASAVGTIFDVRVHGKVTIITVVEGAVLVQTPHGSVVVKSGQQVRITKGKAPSQPAPVDTAAVTSWAGAIPLPGVPLGTNIALDANGGSIYRWTSQRDNPNHAFDAGNANDGRLDRGWQSAEGQTTDQSLWVRFQGESTYTITGVFLVCAATGGQDPANAARDFEVLASNDPSDAGSGVTPVYSGTCKQASGIQVFQFTGGAARGDARAATPAAVKAAALQFRFKDNHGGMDGIAVAEIGVIGEEEPAVLGTPTPEPTDTPTPTPTATSTVVEVARLSGPGGVDFGRWLYNQISTPQTITITNDGQIAATVQRLDLSEEVQGIFSIVGDSCTDTTLQPGATCTVSLTFQPYDASGNSGSLTVTYGGGQLMIPLSGQGYFLLLNIPTLQAAWQDPNTGAHRTLTASNGIACASATRFGYSFVLNNSDPAVPPNLPASGRSVPLSQPQKINTLTYNGQNGLIWHAILFVQIVGVGSGSVQVQVTDQISGSGSTFQVLTPTVTPDVSEVDQCPADLQPVGRYRASGTRQWHSTM